MEGFLRSEEGGKRRSKNSVGRSRRGGEMRGFIIMRMRGMKGGGGEKKKE